MGSKCTRYSPDASIICACGAVKARAEYLTCRDCWIDSVTSDRDPSPITRWCTLHKVSLLRLSRQAGIAYSTTRDLVRSRRVPRTRTAEALARATGLSVAEVMEAAPRPAEAAE